MFDEKLAADQEVLGGNGQHNLEQGWTVEGPSANAQTNPTVIPQNKPQSDPAPRVIRVDSAEAHDLVNGITTAVGQVASQVGTTRCTCKQVSRPIPRCAKPSRAW